MDFPDDGGGVGRLLRRAGDVEDAAGGGGVEGKGFAQVFGMAEPSLLDAQPDFRTMRIIPPESRKKAVERTRQFSRQGCNSAKSKDFRNCVLYSIDGQIPLLEA